MKWNTVQGISPVNVFHVITDSTNEAEIAQDLDVAFDSATENPFAVLSSLFTNATYTITLLDGVSAGQVFPDTGAFTGGSGGQIIPQVAGVLSLHTNQRGPRGRGRLFLGPVGEAIQDGGILENEYRDASVAGWEEFEAILPTLGTASSLCVASYTHEEAMGITSISMRLQTGTVRRRLNQLL